MFFDPFKMYDEMLGMFTEKYNPSVETVWLTKEIPSELEDEFNNLVDKLLEKHGYNPRDFDFEEEDLEDE